MENDDFDPNAMPAAALAEVGDFDDMPETAATGLAILTERVEQLLRLCERLGQENQILREQNEALHADCDLLREKHARSRSRIDAMVVRLKDLEQAS